MLLSIIAAAVGGASLAALVLVFSKLTRIEVPRWLYPAAAGFGMIALTVYTEYSWFSNARSELPENVEIVETFTRTSTLQPWTFVAPRIDRFMAVDHSSARQNDAVENVVLVDVYLMERLNPTLLATQFIQCETGERMLAGGATEFDEGGLPAGREWTMLGLDNPLVVAVCRQHNAPPA